MFPQEDVAAVTFFSCCWSALLAEVEHLAEEDKRMLFEDLASVERSTASCHVLVEFTPRIHHRLTAMGLVSLQKFMPLEFRLAHCRP